MLEILQPQAGADMRRPSAMLTEFLVNAAQPDGCLELMLSVPDRCVLLQGWGDCPAAPFQAVLASHALSCFQAEAGTFARADVPAPATGVMLALPPDAAASLAGLSAVFLLSADRLHRITLHQRRLLDPSDSIGHIRAMQPVLSCSESMRSLLRSTLHHRYEGRDTLNIGERPVRAAVDLAAATHGVGAYLSGWVFDPAASSPSVELCAEGFAAPLDPFWVRVPRNDVSAAFTTSPLSRRLARTMLASPWPRPSLRLRTKPPTCASPSPTVSAPSCRCVWSAWTSQASARRCSAASISTSPPACRSSSSIWRRSSPECRRPSRNLPPSCSAGRCDAPKPL